MKVELLGTIKLDKKIKYNVSNSLENCLKYIDDFLIYLKEHKAPLIDEFIAKVMSKMKSSIIDNYELGDSYVLGDLNEKLEFLSRNQGFVDVIASLYLSLLKISRDKNWKSEKISILHLNLDKANYFPRYYLAEQLTEILEREETIQLFKDFIDQRIIKNLERPYRETMTEVYELDVKNGKTSESSKYISALMHEGLYAGRVDRCMGHEALKELKDPELAELVTCYGDFEMIKKTNDNFVLTRTCTLHTGPYCDNLYHDTRICKKIKHLPREFYDTLHEKNTEG